MPVTSLAIRLYDGKTLALQSILVHYENVRWTRRVYELGDFQLSVHDNNVTESHIQRNALVEFRRDGVQDFVGIVRTRRYNPLTGMWTISGPDLRWFLSLRSVVPDTQTGNDEIQLWTIENPTAGSFQIDHPFLTGPTADIAFDASVATIQSAIDTQIPSIGGTAQGTIEVSGTAVGGGSGGTIQFKFHKHANHTHNNGYGKKKVPKIKIEPIQQFIPTGGNIGVTTIQEGTAPVKEFVELPTTVTETVMKTLVKNHLTEPVDSDRDINNVVTSFTVEDDEARGQVLSFSERYENLLEVLFNISRGCTTWFDVVFDPDTPKYEFRVYTFTDATSDSTAAGITPVVFSSGLENLSEMEYVEDDMSAKNHVYVLGQELGDHREVYEYSDSASIADIFRREIVIDSRDSEDIASLDLAGRTEVTRSLDQIITATGQPIIVSTNSVYRTDWDLGYDITFGIPRHGISVNRRIVGVEVVYEEGSEQIQLTFGDFELGDTSYIAVELAETDHVKYSRRTGTTKGTR